MPVPGLSWFHVVISTYNSWLPGDPRGFRTRHHRIHSSGDYHKPPPAGEHHGLYLYSQSLVGRTAAIEIPPPVRATIGQALIATLARRELRILAVAVGGHHAHMLLELPPSYETRRDLIGQGKRASSHAARRALPGRVWGSGGKFVTIKDRRHQLQTLRYIAAHASQGAWVWTWRDPLPGHMPGC